MIRKRLSARDIAISIPYKRGRANGAKTYHTARSSVLGLFSCGIYNGWDVGGAVRGCSRVSFGPSLDVVTMLRHTISLFYGAQHLVHTEILHHVVALRMYLMFLGVYSCESVLVDEGGSGADARARPVRSRRRCIVSWIGDDFHTETDKHKRSRSGRQEKRYGED